MQPTIHIRKAAMADVPRLREVIEASVRGLQAGDYSPAQIEGALKSVYGVDTQLIADGTYFVVEGPRPDKPEPPDSQGRLSPHSPWTGSGDRADLTIVACGGWSKRKTLYGGDQFAGREDSLLDPTRDAAKIRAFFVHPDWARRGIGTMILDACEKAAVEAGFTHLEMGATLSGVPFYRARGYEEVENQSVAMGNGESLPIVKMRRKVREAGE
ncbi:MAG TPA: GNAT family N-acetyltransferase [Candidatus Binatia bacterium]|nr:GNAT family N-acetyltransferase [Candidatus Binatia bacterium]